MPQELVLRNARIVLRDEVLDGAVLIRNGKIADITSVSNLGEDIGGDFLIPGLVELHTDHLEGHYSPRPGVRWNAIAAVQAHDAQIAASGITTVFDCLRMGSDEDGSYGPGEMRLLADAIETAQNEGRLRAEHLLHLRCEVSAPDVLESLEQFLNDTNVRLASLMDHAPGQRQFQTMDQYTLYYKTKRGLSDEAFAVYIADILVAPDRQGEGIGREITQALLDHYPIDRLHHQVLVAERGAEGFYTRLGMRPVGTFGLTAFIRTREPRP